MSIATVHANAFYEQAVRDGSVFTVLEDDSFLIFPVRDKEDKEVVPFWSSQSRVEKMQATHPKYAQYAISKIPLAEFLEKTLAQFEEENINVGVNWSGKRLVGYDVSVADLRRNIAYRLGKIGGRG